MPSDLTLKIFAISPQHIHIILIMPITIFGNRPVGVIDMQRVLWNIFNEFLNVIDVYCDKVSQVPVLSARTGTSDWARL